MATATISHSPCFGLLGILATSAVDTQDASMLASGSLKAPSSIMGRGSRRANPRTEPCSCCADEVACTLCWIVHSLAKPDCAVHWGLSHHSTHLLPPEPETLDTVYLLPRVSYAEYFWDHHSICSEHQVLPSLVIGFRCISRWKCCCGFTPSGF